MMLSPIAHFASQALRWRVALPIICLLWGVYLVVLHPWLINWGTTPAEVGMALPGDDPVRGPNAYFTRLFRTIIDAGWVSQLSHAAYLGKELATAGLTLRHGFPYVQDAT